MKKHRLHTQEWRDFQALPDAESTSERFKAALVRAEERVRKKGRKVAADSLVAAMAAAEGTIVEAQTLTRRQVGFAGKVKQARRG